MYRLLLTNLSFVMALAVVIATFITAKTYTQLGIAIILYPLLAFFAYKVFADTIWRSPSTKTVTYVHPLLKVAETVEDVKKENVGVADIDKRLFLKLIGATGLSFFLISIFGRRVESWLFGQNLGTQPAPSAGKTIAAAASPTDGYTISETDDSIVGYYGFINKEGAWFIMKRDQDSGSFRYVKGASDFPKNWKNRENLKYDYFYNIFVY